jgi:TRAP-type uncharacterized transport system substrate-binding protein
MSEVPARSFRGQEHPLITVGNPGYSIVVRQDMSDDLAYRLARALDVDSTTHGVSEDIFYSPRHAPHAGAPTHPGASTYYDEVSARYTRSKT